MIPTAYVDGRYAPLSRAAVSIQDRGFQFGDAVYEVWAARGGRLLDEAAHFARLRRSLAELRIPEPMSTRSLGAVIRETMRRNRVHDGVVYLQISRGAAPRDHAFPVSANPTLIVTAKSQDKFALTERAEQGVKVITFPENRWARRDIKSTNLLGNVLAKQAAIETGAHEAWFVDAEGLVTEGASSTAWIVDAQGRLRTRPLSNDILHGITRASFLRLAQERQIDVSETAFTPAEIKSAREALLTSAGTIALPVIAVDGDPIGEGRPGPLATALRAAYLGAESDR